MICWHDIMSPIWLNELDLMGSLFSVLTVVAMPFLLLVAVGQTNYTTTIYPGLALDG
jgi:hypothetical protein